MRAKEAHLIAFARNGEYIKKHYDPKKFETILKSINERAKEGFMFLNYNYLGSIDHAIVNKHREQLEHLGYEIHQTEDIKAKETEFTLYITWSNIDPSELMKP